MLKTDISRYILEGNFSTAMVGRRSVLTFFNARFVQSCILLTARTLPLIFLSEPSTFEHRFDLTQNMHRFADELRSVHSVTS